MFRRPPAYIAKNHTEDKLIEQTEIFILLNYVTYPKRLQENFKFS